MHILNFLMLISKNIPILSALLVSATILHLSIIYLYCNLAKQAKSSTTAVSGALLPGNKTSKNRCEDETTERNRQLSGKYEFIRAISLVRGDQSSSNPLLETKTCLINVRRDG